MSLSLPASLAPSVWFANQMATPGQQATSSGHAALDRELPNQGWPHGSLTELLLPQAGVGEMRLLQPALAALGARRIALLQPPHLPQVAAWAGWGLPAERLLWIRPQRAADALWCAEQVLRNGSCGALLFWQGALRAESLRRLQLAAQHADLLFWTMRPLAAAAEASPAPLRIALQPVSGGVRLDILKRRGPQCAHPVHLQWPLRRLPVTRGSHDAYLDRAAPAAPVARSAAPALV